MKTLSLLLVSCVFATQNDDSLTLLQIDVHRHKWDKSGPPSWEGQPLTNNLFIGDDTVESCGEAGVLMDKEVCLGGLVIRKTSNGDNRDEYFHQTYTTPSKCHRQGAPKGCFIIAGTLHFNDEEGCKEMGWKGARGWHDKWNQLAGVVCGGKGMKPLLSCATGVGRQRIYIDRTNASCSEGGAPLMNKTMCGSGNFKMPYKSAGDMDPHPWIGGFTGTYAGPHGNRVYWNGLAKDTFNPERSKHRLTWSCGNRTNCGGIPTEEDPSFWKPGCFVADEQGRPTAYWNLPGVGTPGEAGLGRQICEVLECYGGGTTATTTATTTTTTTTVPIGANCDLTEPLLFSSVSGDLDSRDGLRFPNVKSGIDLIMRTVEQGAYSAADASSNGLVGDFARINVKCGSDVIVEAITVQSGTMDQVVQKSIAFTLFDMDEGKRHKGRVSLQACGTTGASFPSTTELSVFEANGCILIGSCVKGKKGNDPTGLSTLTEDHTKRSASLFWANTARVTFKLAVGAGKGGRNFQFAFVPTNACLPEADNSFRPAECCPKGACQNNIDFLPP